MAMINQQNLIEIRDKTEAMRSSALHIVNEVMDEIHEIITKVIDSNQKGDIDNFSTIQQLQLMNLNLQNRFLDVQNTMVDLTRDYKEVIRSIDKALRDVKENL